MTMMPAEIDARRLAISEAAETRAIADHAAVQAERASRLALYAQAVTQDHERLHQIVESAVYQQPAQVFRVPTVWPHVMG